MMNIQWTDAGVTEDPSTKAKINGRTYLAADSGYYFYPMIWNEELGWLMLAMRGMSERDAQRYCERHAMEAV